LAGPVPPLVAAWAGLGPGSGARRRGWSGWEGHGKATRSGRGWLWQDMIRTKEDVLAIDMRRFVVPRGAVLSRGRWLHPGLRYRGRRWRAVRRRGDGAAWRGAAWAFPAGQRDGAAAGMAAADVSARAGFVPGRPGRVGPGWREPSQEAWQGSWAMSGMVTGAAVIFGG